ncbi:hypothetical protein ENKNEFLB_02868 [Nocardioides aquaticus]|uniref:Kinase n=2 Tax=Actinomycetes TaxID=1760 RepID=A0ABX8EIX9_9ACTN|nr:hypothetical protein [Nocardioides aquaticus]QVT80469.1 hypothetical protein ENKNEFLB_02868 [Nocardioides aquaticus]
MRAMLYYPFVQPPRDVLAQGVLYWDQMGSIVPKHYQLPDYLQQISDRGLYRPLSVDEYVSDVSLDRLVGEVEGLLTELPRGALALPRDPLTSATRLHYGKLPYELEFRLKNAGLLRDVATSYQASEALLGPLLTLLARAVADGERDPTIGWVCHTNVARAAAMAFEGASGTGAPAWRLKMGWIFKVPPPGTPLEELLDFRARYEDERIELLRAVDKLAVASGGLAAPDLLPQIAEELDYAMRQIDKAAKGRGLKLRKAASYGTLTAGVGAAATAAEAFGPVGAAASAGVFGVLGSLLLGATQTFVRPEVASPYNYLHRARAQFGD